MEITLQIEIIFSSQNITNNMSTITRAHSTINSPSSLLNLSENWLLITCSTHLSRIHDKSLKLSRPQGQIIEMRKIDHFGFFQSLLNWQLATCRKKWEGYMNKFHKVIVPTSKC